MTSKSAKDPKTGRFLPRADRAGSVTGSSYARNEGWSLDLAAEATGYTPSEALGFADGFIGCTTPLASGKTPPVPADLFRNEHGK
ncbi:hypothetical protein PWG15_09815 [Ensifer adhaerens]|uniref:hypothetical protein n=1 Tax=Ensifer adhaerens TaxID=106592 RepID=UPI0023A93CE8|nr:hypothetical protein [Ensifer adhaerens]WDZ78758.1 hypothetical protein PWG15_09815 [Ensifer adhaerens]